LIAVADILDRAETPCGKLNEARKITREVHVKAPRIDKLCKCSKYIETAIRPIATWTVEVSFTKQTD